MITSNKQRKYAVEEIEKRYRQLHAFNEDDGDGTLPVVAIQTMRTQLLEEIAEFNDEIAEFDAALTANLSHLEMPSLFDIRKVPIVCRLAKQMTLRDFATVLEVDTRQLTRLEANEYRQCSIERLQAYINTLKQKGVLGEVVLKNSAV